MKRSTLKTASIAQFVGKCGKEVANFGKMWEIVGNSFFI